MILVQHKWTLGALVAIAGSVLAAKADASPFLMVGLLASLIFLPVATLWELPRSPVVPLRYLGLLAWVLAFTLL